WQPTAIPPRSQAGLPALTKTSRSPRVSVLPATFSQRRLEYRRTARNQLFAVSCVRPDFSDCTERLGCFRLHNTHVSTPAQGRSPVPASGTLPLPACKYLHMAGCSGTGFRRRLQPLRSSPKATRLHNPACAIPSALCLLSWCVETQRL